MWLVIVAIGLIYSLTACDKRELSVADSVSTAEKAQIRQSTAKSMNTDYSEMQTQADSIFEKYGAMGAQVAVVDNGEVVASFSYGWATEGTDPMTSEHKIRVASISKIAVAMAAMLLREDGMVDIDEDIGVYWNTSAVNPS